MANEASLPREAAARRFVERAKAVGFTVAVVEYAQPTRTAQEAAAACGCGVGQIVKSLVYKGTSSGRPYLLLVSGMNRVDEKRLATVVGEAVIRPDAHFVREITGYSIGGIPPLGHDTSMVCYFDRDLLRYDEIWTAAGTPRAVFKVTPARLAELTGGCIVELANQA